MRWKHLGTCLDGTSNTVAIAESVRGYGSEDQASGIYISSVKGGVVGTGDATLHSNGSNRTSNCINKRNPGDNTEIVSGSNTRTMRGCVLYASSATCGVHTILPPNSVSCASGAVGNSVGDWGIYSAQSYHRGGANAGFFDGSVSFISETIDCGSPSAVQVVIGKSEFGIWGALGTPEGKESVSKP
jgi:prepilin-type processing-associated H-X9-DG protein